MNTPDMSLETFSIWAALIILGLFYLLMVFASNWGKDIIQNDNWYYKVQPEIITFVRFTSVIWLFFYGVCFFCRFIFTKLLKHIFWGIFDFFSGFCLIIKAIVKRDITALFKDHLK